MFEEYCLYVEAEDLSVYYPIGGFLTRSSVAEDSNNFTMDMIDQAIGAISKNLGVPSYTIVEIFGLSGSGGWSLEEWYV